MPEGKPRKSFLEVVRNCAASEGLKLPVFPDVVLDLQQLMADPDVSIDKIAKAITKDQGLTTQVMKYANSGFYAGSKGTRTIPEAITRLGLNTIFNCVVTIKQSNYYKSSNPLLDSYLKTSFTHALCVATGTQWLVKQIGYTTLINEAYLAGLMHDIGKLLIIKVIESIQSLKKQAISDVFISEAIEKLHSELGYELMQAWGILDAYCKVAKDHHSADYDTTYGLLLAVRIVNQACTKIGVNTTYERPTDFRNLPEVQILNIEDSVLTDLETVIESAIQ